MRAVVQRVSEAAVRVEGEVVGKIGKGLLVLLGIGHDDGETQIEWMVEKLCGLRIFRDGEGKMNRSVTEEGGGILLVSQFTLLGDARKGKRPSFIAAAPPERSAPLFERFHAALQRRLVVVERGIFGADMAVSLVNDGPVTLVIDSPEVAPLS